MKKLIAIAVLCVASLAMAELDYGLTAEINGAGETVLNYTGTGLDVSIIGFLDNEDGDEVGNITVTSLPSPFNGFSDLSTKATDLTLYNFSASVSFADGDSVNLGVVSDGDEKVWEQQFGSAANQDAYLFQLVPEPASMSMLALGGLALIRRRK